MNRHENNSCRVNGATITEPITDGSGISVPIAEGVPSVSEHHNLNRSAEFAKLVKLVKEQAQAENADIGMFIDGEFTHACPVTHASIAPEIRLAFLKHIVEVLCEVQFQLPNEEEFHQSSTTKSSTCIPDDQT